METDWVFEEKYDGIRALAYRAARGSGCTDLVLDGDIVAFDPAGVSRCQLLQRRRADARVRPVFAIFDVLRSRGHAPADGRA